MNTDILQCALGVHRYDEKLTNTCLRCSICKRAEYFKTSTGREIWTEYNAKGRIVHYKDSQGVESRYEYDEKGKMIHIEDLSTRIRYKA